jgi:hypothetical protein
MTKYHDKDGTSWHFLVLNYVFRNLAENGAVKIIDNSRKYLLFTSTEELGSVVDSN